MRLRLGCEQEALGEIREVLHSRVDSMASLFKEMDKRGTGQIDEEDWASALTKLGLDIPGIPPYRHTERQRDRHLASKTKRHADSCVRRQHWGAPALQNALLCSSVDATTLNAYLLH